VYFIFVLSKYGGQARLAQSVEHETLNLRVVGSSPTLGAPFAFFARRPFSVPYYITRAIFALRASVLVVLGSGNIVRRALKTIGSCVKVREVKEEKSPFNSRLRSPFSAASTLAAAKSML
jgi:hypothetical protein